MCFQVLSRQALLHGVAVYCGEEADVLGVGGGDVAQGRDHLPLEGVQVEPVLLRGQIAVLLARLLDEIGVGQRQQNPFSISALTYGSGGSTGTGVAAVLVRGILRHFLLFLVTVVVDVDGGGGTSSVSIQSALLELAGPSMASEASIQSTLELAARPAVFFPSMAIY